MAYIGAGITRFNTADELTVTGTSEFGGNVSFGDNNITNVGSLQIDSIAGDADTNTNITFAGSDVITMTTAGSERLRLDASGNVGIGTSSPDHNLTLSANSNPIFEMVQVAGGPYKHQIAVGGNDLQLRASSGALIMYTGNADGASSTERMRIDHSGNLLVGKTSNDSTTVGANIRADKSFFTSSGQEALVLNRNTSDGTILEFRKANGTVGSIGTGSSRLYIGISNVGLYFATAGVLPWNTSTNASRDNAIDLGNSGTRFDDIFATNGTIQTSDQQEKNTITDSDLGLDFINRLSPKSYIFNGKTRTHYGLIAQDVETVLGDISKPTSGFAGFIKSDISEEEDGSEYRYGLRYTEFVGPLIKALQEADAKIEALEARIAALEGA